MNSEELRSELRKQAEREQMEGIVGEYLRTWKVVAEAGDGSLSSDDIRVITMTLCKMRHVFDTPISSCR